MVKEVCSDGDWDSIYVYILPDSKEQTSGCHQTAWAQVLYASLKVVFTTPTDFSFVTLAKLPLQVFLDLTHEELTILDGRHLLGFLHHL